MSLIGKHALITGGSRGIGRGIALKLAEQGAKIAVHYYQNQSAAEATLARIRELGSDGMLVQADVCRTEDVSRIFQQVGNEFGKVDIFVSNARPEAPTFYQAPMDIGLDKLGCGGGFASQGLSRRGSGSSTIDAEWRSSDCNHVRAGRAVWQLAAVGGYGGGEGGHGSACPVFCCRSRESRDNCKHHQPWLD
jgi:NAD(P)-dependent dehydrogenase (short-subunit alcohol dehydrogenase family)